MAFTEQITFDIDAMPRPFCLSKPGSAPTPLADRHCLAYGSGVNKEPASKRFFRRASAYWLLGQLLVLISLAQLMVRLLPFRIYARWLQRPNQNGDAPPEFVRSLRRKIWLAAEILPWEPQCLPQALAGRFILDRRGYASSFSLGVSDPNDMLKAHAWLTSGDLYVSGREQMQHYREVVRF
jgi:hypothetical protein